MTLMYEYITVNEKRSFQKMKALCHQMNAYGLCIFHLSGGTIITPK
jgi:hypothetical protein